MDEKDVTIPAISCGHCVATIERELGELDGIDVVRGDPYTKRVTIRWSAPADWIRITEVLDDIGFPPEGS